MSGIDVINSISSVIIVFVIVCFLWFGFWKLVLEPNPIIRDFFDLDKPKKDRKAK